VIPLRRSIGAILKMIRSTQTADAVVLYEHRREDRTISMWDPPGLDWESGLNRAIRLVEDDSAWLRDLEVPLVLEKSTKSERSHVALLQDYTACVLIPLARHDGRNLLLPNLLLYVAWRHAALEPDIANLRDWAESLTVILGRLDREQLVQTLMMEVTRLQLELADCKIAERTAGLIPRSMAERVDPEIVRQHIARVLESCADTTTLEKRIEQLKAELASRERISRAKALVQRKYGITEEQAYLHLQRASRRARRPLIQVAEEIA
jgi:hypothetical protein